MCVSDKRRRSWSRTTSRASDSLSLCVFFFLLLPLARPSNRVPSAIVPGVRGGAAMGRSEEAKGNTATTRPARLPNGARWVGLVAGGISGKPHHFHCLRRRLRKVRSASLLLLLSNDSIAAVPIALSRFRFSIRCVFCHRRRAPSASHRDHCLFVFEIYYLYRFRRPLKTTAANRHLSIFLHVSRHSRN